MWFDFFEKKMGATIDTTWMLGPNSCWILNLQLLLFSLKLGLIVWSYNMHSKHKNLDTDILGLINKEQIFTLLHGTSAHKSYPFIGITILIQLV